MTTSYNLLDIPYAYPPLGFFIARFLSDVFNVPEIALLRFLPALFSVAGIFAFYLVAKSVLKDNVRAALATALLAVTPGGYLWHIMGGGLTRALGNTFLLLSAFALLRLFEHGGWKRLLLTILFCSLAVLSHPEVALHTAGTCALIWIFYGRSRYRSLQAIGVGLGTLLATSVWWLTVILRFGLEPFLSTLHTGLYGASIWSAVMGNIFARISLIPVFPILRIAGIAWCLWKRKFFLVAWLVFPVLVEPRSSDVIAFYPLSMLAALGFTDALPALINWFRARRSLPLLSDVTYSRVLNLAIVAVILYLFLESFFVNATLVENSLKPPALDAMQWVQGNTPADSQFLVITGNTGVMTDPLPEWFPALANRRSQNTLQGLEWTLGSEFPYHVIQLTQLQACATSGCIETWADENEIPYSHLVTQKDTIPLTLLDSLQSGKYHLLYENQEIAVFRRPE
jgi:hypothetical protein